MPKKGYEQTKKHRKKLSIKKLGNKIGLGKHWKLSEGVHKGKKNPAWKDGRCNDENYLSWIKNKRNRKKRDAEGSHTFGEWETLKAQYNWTCPCCHKSEPEIKLTEDHIVPLSEGGSDNIENIQPLCKSCNSIKHTKIIKYAKT